MTNYDETAGTEDPSVLLEAFLQSMKDEDATPDLPGEPTEDELWAEENLRGLQMEWPAVVLAAAEMMIPPGEPSPEGRARMIETARRALAERRKMHGLLPVLLRSVREQSGLSLVDAATRAGFDSKDLAGLERGDTEVNLDLPVERVLSWIGAVTVDGDLALAALRRSLDVARNDSLSLAAGSPDRPKTIDAYVKEVASGLEAVERDSQ
jgi:hypothetical protein